MKTILATCDTSLEQITHFQYRKVIRILKYTFHFVITGDKIYTKDIIVNKNSLKK